MIVKKELGLYISATTPLNFVTESIAEQLRQHWLLLVCAVLN